MKALEDILSGYRKTVSLLREVPFLTDIPCLIAARLILPGLLCHLVSESGRSRENYHCYGGYCEADRKFASMPWVACRVRNPTAKRQEGYVVGLMFREDMAGCWLSLNRGHEIYKQRRLGIQEDHDPGDAGTADLTSIISVPAPWIAGPIDLAATTDLTRCHEAGAAISRYYDASQLPSEGEFQQAFLQLLDWYDMLGNGQ
ncbi:MrcB family domain-containing protein [Novosphingobium album (ex Hu et al. 2023)]|uniref:DUF3578 domain-containing protein n=1 Tax=Novosphingobium album (ex Hu et al. 2023) TaxID=2930093 RepID=A0ABT0B820_9SPHN|nr:DUF3578 domain-containing protein [Novosphingobium album (ex Hu et al. 2023)]MCJ2181021.1 DUF3578 domain-containing protein [Novosphingobium album (ex Hu et al. 2023)]